jgi:hypothetical protein
MEVAAEKGMRSKNVTSSLAGGRFVAALALLVAGLCLMPSLVMAQQNYVVQPIAEMKVKQLPKGDFYWHVESFPTLDAAKAAAPPYRWNPDTVSYEGLPSLTAEVTGKAWLFILGPKGRSPAGGTEVAEIGPVPPLNAPEYLPRAAGLSDTSTHAFRLGSILRDDREIGSTNPGRGDERRGRAFDEWTSRWDDHAGLQQRDYRLDSADHVRRRRDQAILCASQVSVGQTS